MAQGVIPLCLLFSLGSFAMRKYLLAAMFAAALLFSTGCTEEAGEALGDMVAEALSEKVSGWVEESFGLSSYRDGRPDPSGFTRTPDECMVHDGHKYWLEGGEYRCDEGRAYVWACTKCGKEYLEGRVAPAAHRPEETLAEAGTCLSAAHYVSCCSVCGFLTGERYDYTDMPHDFSGGACILCGQPDTSPGGDG